MTGHKIDGFYLRDKKPIKCPQCGKMFAPAPEHSYYAGNSKTKLVCSYRCMREWDKANMPSRSTYVKKKGKER